MVVTIVVLLILAGISLNLVLGNNGIVTKANLAVVKQENATVAEAMQFKVNYYDMDSIKDISAVLQNDGIMDANGIVNTYTLLEQKLKTGNGSNNKDVYVIEDGCLYYYDKNEEKIDLGNLWSLQTTDLEETDPSLFEVDDEGTLWLKESETYYWEKTWTIENLVIPETVDGKKVKKLIFTKYGSEARRGINGWNNIKTVIIPEGVTCIGERAFLYCNNLKSIVIPNSVTSIESLAFKGCTSLENINIPDSVINVGQKSFDETLYYENQPDGDVYIGKVYYKPKGTLKDNKVEIKDGTIGIADNAFGGVNDLTNIILPNSIVKIGVGAFSYCTELTSIIIPNGVTRIEDSTFWGCKNLLNVTIPNSVTSIGEFAFWTCSNLQSAIIPNSVTSIENYAFGGCKCMLRITIPISVTTTGESLFSSWDSGQTINCEASEKPDGWSNYWNSSCSAQINWNVKQ